MVILPQNLKATLQQITMKTTKNPPPNVYSVTWCTISRYYSIVINTVCMVYLAVTLIWWFGEFLLVRQI